MQNSITGSAHAPIQKKYIFINKVTIISVVTGSSISVCGETARAHHGDRQVVGCSERLVVGDLLRLLGFAQVQTRKPKLSAAVVAAAAVTGVHASGG